MSKFTNAIRMLAKMKALDAKAVEKLINAHEVEQDGGPGSGNFGHAGRPGKKGGSAPKGGGSGGSSGGKSTTGSGNKGKFTYHFYEQPKEYYRNTGGTTSSKGAKVTLAKEPFLGYGTAESQAKTHKGYWASEPKKEPITIRYKPSSASSSSGVTGNTGYTVRNDPEEEVPYTMYPKDPKKEADLEKKARELGFKDLDQMRRAGRGMVTKEEMEEIERRVAGEEEEEVPYTMYPKDPKKEAELEKKARELGFKDLDQMRRAGKGMLTKEEMEEIERREEPYSPYDDNDDDEDDPHTMYPKDPKKVEELEKKARELGFKDLDQMRRAGRGMVSKAEMEEIERRSEKMGSDCRKTIRKSTARDKYIKALRRLAIDRQLTASSAEALLNARTSDGGPGSGNFGHSGRPGKVGGSTKTGTGGYASGNAGVAKNGTVYSGKDYSLKARGLRTIKKVKTKDGKIGWSGPGKTWQSVGKKSKFLPKGSGTTKISEPDIASGIHTINKFLNEDGTLTPERAALHDKIIQDMFAGKKPKGPGEQKTFYFLGGGSASGKGSFTREDSSKRYGMPNKNEVTVVDADELKKKLPEYDVDSDTGTTDRNKAANFAHEESSALAKRAMEAAFANGHDVTLDGTGDSGVNKVLKKIEQARAAGYRVEGRYCTASIENALVRNSERAKEEKRIVDKDSVIRIHKDVSKIFETIAPHFDHVELWDHDGPEPVLVATCERGGKVKKHNAKLWKKFLAKANWTDPDEG